MNSSEVCGLHIIAEMLTFAVWGSVGLCLLNACGGLVYLMFNLGLFDVGVGWGFGLCEMVCFRF